MPHVPSSAALADPTAPSVSPPQARCGRSSSRAGRAILHTLVLAGFLTALGCNRGESKDAAAAGVGTARERVTRLVELFTPLPKTVTSDKTDAQFIAGQSLLAELSAAGPEVGREALARLREVPDGVRPQGVERALLTVAARAAPADSGVLLENLVTQYGSDISLRTEALLLLAEVHPARAKEILEPMVRDPRAPATLPPQEFRVRGWVTACEKTNTDPVPVLVDVAANMFQEESARVRAVAELGRHPGNRLAEQALSTILVESTGDGYLRRKAAQSLIAILPRETVCSLLTQVVDKEADLNMLVFLRDALDKHCKQ